MFGLPTLGAFALRNWQAVLGIVAVAILATLLTIRTDQRDDALAALDQSRAKRIEFALRVRVRAERTLAAMTRNALVVERAQTQISQEVSRDYQARIADLHRRIAALGNRVSETRNRADTGRPGFAAMPGISGATGGPDGAASQNRLPSDDAVHATVQAIRLDELQGWLRRQLAVDRTMPVEP